MSQRRPILAKEKFLEGNRQKWAALFVILGILTMYCSAYGLIKDPAPFLGYFTGIGVSFILGASGSDIMKAYKIESSTSNENVKQESVTEVKVTIDKEIREHIKEEGMGAPVIKPFSQLAKEEEPKYDY